MSIGDEFARLVSDDELCAEVRLAVEGGDEDTLRRLGFGAFAEYAQRLSELMSDSVREGHDPQAEGFAAIMEEVARPAHYAHHLVNEAGTAVQRAKDEPLGIHMKPIETDFDDEAFRSTVGNAASKDDPTETAGALADGLGYFVKKLGNDFIKANAEAHSRAGFEVKVKRSGSTKCCPWCAARIGSWAIANAPDGVFGCHANCSCTVEYTSSTGAKTSARGANLHRYGTGAFVEVGYEPPHVGAVRGAEKAPHRLTGGANGGILSTALKLENFIEADPKKVVSNDCRVKIIQVLKSQGFSFDYDDVRIVDIPPDKEGRYEAIRTNAVATPSYPIVYLELNKRVFSGKTLEEIDEVFSQQNYCTANSLEEAIIHECGHLRVLKNKTYTAYARIDETLKGSEFTSPVPERKDKKSLKDLAGTISPYAQKDGLECIAESEVVLFRGEELSDELKKLYDKYTS